MIPRGLTDGGVISCGGLVFLVSAARDDPDWQQQKAI
jgi:hypothetical protein